MPQYGSEKRSYVQIVDFIFFILIFEQQPEQQSYELVYSNFFYAVLRQQPNGLPIYF